MTPEEAALAECRLYPKEWFFPEKANHLTMWDKAAPICEVCEVAAPCLADSVEEPWGYWAGTTPEDRGFGRADSIMAGPRGANRALAEVLRSNKGARLSVARLQELTTFQWHKNTIHRCLRDLRDRDLVEIIVQVDNRPQLYVWIGEE